MFSPEDFELTLEAQLKLRVLKDEIAGCSDIKMLQDNLTEMSELCMRYQNIINNLLREKLTANMDEFLAIVEEEIAKKDNS